MEPRCTLSVVDFFLSYDGTRKWRERVYKMCQKKVRQKTQQRAGTMQSNARQEARRRGKVRLVSRKAEARYAVRHAA
jgi:hypothetical protein